MRARDLLLGEVVEPQRQPLGGAAVVDEQDRRLVRFDQLDQLGVDRRPDRAAGRLAARQRIDVRRGCRVGLDHRLDRDVDLEVELLAHAGVDDPAAAPRPDHEPPDLLERVLRRRQPDPLHVVAGCLGQPLERQRQVRAALGRGDRVDLVDDAPARAVEQLARAPGQHQVQRLGRRDQDVGRVAQHLLTLALGRIPGADRHLQVSSDPAQWRAEVAIDVVGERLQRRHVDEADPPVTRVLGTRRRCQLVDRVQERGQRLAGASRRRDQHVLAGRDRRPGLLLRRGRRLER